MVGTPCGSSCCWMAARSHQTCSRAILPRVKGKWPRNAVVLGAGGAGLLLYLKALAVGPMGVVAPLSAVVGAGLPLLVGVLGGERPGRLPLPASGA